ncbi:GlsB/YeaQ/YmgE family stress response membrane protein [Occultella glacieicola]|uniref:GlsB/YeaQ/YmgE family stress response membrane protein n=1 Tax=Occultella glacieicola TaxID=2518684 RepID=A0ABY2DYY1_9MICO|nr:GlsB/YeaQ/YmgE family stress response membrane protein [Occultella glacieicola]TDE88311.1 GlsB/YeaQ/YmgE family stress response membrane protein [Occultella glacieicola]
MGEIIGVIVFGAVIGVIARLVRPGPQKIGMLWTVIIGIAGALIGYLISGWLGVQDTDGIDWIRWVISIVAAVILLGVYLGLTAKKGTGGSSVRK